MTDEPDPSIAELAALVAARAGRTTGIPGLSLVAVDRPTAPTSALADASFAFVARGAKRVTVGDRVLDYAAGDYLVVSVDMPVTGQFTSADPFLGIGLTLDRSAIADLVLGARTAPAPCPGPALGVGRASPELLDALIRLLRLIDEPADRDVLAPLVVREILWRLLRGPQGHLVRAVGTAGSALARIHAAVTWLRAHYDEPFRVEDLAAGAAMSPSTFHRRFRAATGTGPVQFQKRIRLQQARLLLTGSGRGVTEVAHAVGYASTSQFSREFRREHGVAPRAVDEESLRTSKYH